MMLDPGPTTDRPAPARDPEAEIHHLRHDLERMRMYAQALEERCNHLWTYVPDTHGTQDPVLLFVALSSPWRTTTWNAPAPDPSPERPMSAMRRSGRA